MKILKLYFCLILLFPFGKTIAQTPFQIQGGVIDAQTKQPLEKVNIINLANPTEGTVTNQNGIFQFQINQVPTTLQISFIGYEAQNITIESPSEREFIIELIPTPTALPEIAVSSKRKVDTVFFKPYSVVDYVFLEDKILLLAHRNSIEKYTLIALDELTHQPIAEVSLKTFYPKSLLKHCTGEVFLVTNENVYEVKVGSSKIEFPKKIYIDDFYLIDHPCVLANEKFLYFARYFYQGQALRYHAFARTLTPEQQSGVAPTPTDSLEKIEFPLIQNEDNIVRLIEEVGLRMPWSGDIWDENVMERLELLRGGDYGLTGIMKIFYPKLNAPIFQKGEELLIFNHRESALQFFDKKGEQGKSISIDYHQTRKWKKRIFFDDFQNRAYTSFNTRWGEKIQEIDLENGKLKTAIPIDFAFIEKPIVRNGFLYFLYKNSWAGERRYVLHKMKID